ncbi:MAG: hypothetical protein Q9M48_13150 [Rhodobacterales bacterium]|nr:hypothetical protein [Rhodobacterales bacterium]
MGVLWALPVWAQAGPESCVLERWGYVLDPYEQDISAIETIETDAGVVRIFEYGALSGDYAKLYIFLLEGTTCFSRAVVVGSFTEVNARLKPAERGPEGRFFHMGIFTAQRYENLAYFKVRPAFDDMREAALGLLGKL